jgi:hypothetical protein
MSSQTERNDPCGCGSGKKYRDCCGTPQLEVASVRVKDVKDVELTPGLTLSDHPKPANEYHLKTGQRE